MEKADVAIVGGGILGLASAVELAGKHQHVAVLEAEEAIATHQTGHNSGVIHAGLYYPPGTFKADLCRRGRELMYRFCEEHGVPHRRTGKLVIAVDQADLARLDSLADRGRLNGLSIERLSADRLAEFEPHAAGKAGLWVPETGIVDYGSVAAALGGLLERRGGTLRLGARVNRIERIREGYRLHWSSGVLEARALVNCAGLQSDRVARMAGADPGIRIVPFRGEYFQLRPSSAGLVRGLIYPVPDPALPFLGVHFTRRIDGRVEAGPNAVLAGKREGYRRGDVSYGDLRDWFLFPGFWRLLGRHWRTGLDEAVRSRSKSRFTASLRRLVPSLGESDLEPGGAGVRAQALARDGSLVSDFVFVDQAAAVHVLNAPSPAATASLAIANIIAERLVRNC